MRTIQTIPSRPWLGAAALACLLTIAGTPAAAAPPATAKIVPAAVLDFSMPPRNRPRPSMRHKPLLSRSFARDDDRTADVIDRAGGTDDSERDDESRAPAIPNIHRAAYQPPLDAPPAIPETPPAPPAPSKKDDEEGSADSERSPDDEGQPAPTAPDSGEPDAEFAESDAEFANPTRRANSAPIDLGSALQIAAGDNPRVGFAQQRISEAFARLQSAEVLWVPSIRLGANYNKHDGVLQDASGRIIENSRSSIYTGMGARAVGTSSPAVPGLVMDFHLRDAIFQPRIAEQRVGARQHAGRAATNDILLNTALAYLDLLEAMQIEAVAGETLTNAEQLANLTESFAESGEGLRADAERAQAELSVRRIEFRRAGEKVRVASARLTRLLSRDQSRTLVPREPALAPIELVALDTPLPKLISVGLSSRPELAASQYLVGEAVQRLRREKYAPLVPSVLLGFSYGGNGGSPSSDINDFGDRADFDASIYWEVRNLGFGEQSARDEARSRLEQARWKQIRVMDQVASDVAQGHAQVTARKDQIALAQEGITAARNSLRRNIERIRNGQGLPIETLQAIQALDRAQREYVRTVADYNRAQFRLHRALGWPAQ